MNVSFASSLNKAGDGAISSGTRCAYPSASTPRAGRDMGHRSVLTLAENFYERNDRRNSEKWSSTKAPS